MVILYIYSTCWRMKLVFYEHQHSCSAASRHWLVGIPLLKKQGTCTPFHNRMHDGPPSLLPHHAGRIDVVVIHAQSPFTVSGALHGLDDKKVMVPGTPCIISGVGSERPLRFSSMI
jgi:hypothetical protein